MKAHTRLLSPPPRVYHASFALARASPPREASRRAAPGRCRVRHLFFWLSSRAYPSAGFTGPQRGRQRTCVRATMGGDDDEEARRERKRLKKLRRKQEAAAAAAAAAAGEEEEAAADEEAERPQKKKKKKQRKEAEDADADDAAAAADADEEAPRPKKKKHEQREAAPSVVALSKAQSSVGTASAGAAKFRKQFYTEHAAVAAMTDKARAPGAAVPPTRRGLGRGAANQRGGRSRPPGDPPRPVAPPAAAATDARHRRPASAAAAVQAVAALREKLQISVESKAGTDFRPITAFEHAGFSADVLAACKCVQRGRAQHRLAFPPAHPFHATAAAARRGFKQPSPIQAQCWPIILSGACTRPVTSPARARSPAAARPRALAAAARARSGGHRGDGVRQDARVRAAGADAHQGAGARGGARGHHPGAGAHARAGHAVRRGRHDRGRPLQSPLRLHLRRADAPPPVPPAAHARCQEHPPAPAGGAPKGPQRAALNAGSEIVVATPGRLQDFMEEGAVRRAAHARVRLTLDVPSGGRRALAAGCRAARCSCWTRRTACWTWASSPRSAPLRARCARTGRR